MPSKKLSLDALDYQILQNLHADARRPASDIARLTGANERTIRKRIERLVAEGIIRMTAILDPVAFGYITAADIFLQADPAHEEEILQQLMSLPPITYIALGQDGNEISIEARFKDNEALRQFLRHTLTEIPGLTVTRYTLVPRILRNIDEWMPQAADLGITAKETTP